MKKKVLGALLVLLLVALAGAAVPFTDTFASTLTERHQDPPPDDGDGSSGSSCTYCSDSNCECATPPSNCVLYSSCGCSSVDCWRSCEARCF